VSPDPADAKGAGRIGSKVIVDASGNPISDGAGNIFKSNPCITISFIILVILSSVIVVLATSTTVLDAYIDRSANANSLSVLDDDGGALITDEDLDFTFYRTGYDVLDQFLPEKSTVLKYKFLSTYDGVIEPFGTMHLLPLSFDNYTSYDYKYTVCPDAKSSDSSSVECKHGDLKADGSETPFAIACDPYDTFKVQVTEYYTDDAPVFAGKTRRKADGAMMCMYVRRELRTLTESDLNDTMTAMATLWSISGAFAILLPFSPLVLLFALPLSALPPSPHSHSLSLPPSLSHADTQGQKLFGSDYYSSTYFVQAHEFNSAQQDSDHMHEGVGFLPQHIKLTNMFENSMRSVNPAVSVPYWDYTLDRETLDSIFESSVFSPEIYGTLRPPSDPFWGWTYRNDSIEDGRIFDGRWKDIKVDSNTKYKTLKNSYGTVRGLWTVNPSEYISRFPAYSPKLPGCSTYYSWLSEMDLGTFFYQANNDPHASAHGAIAAVYGCDAMDEMRTGGYIKSADSQVEICSQWGFYLKDMYRLNYLWMQSDCTADTLDMEGIQCGFTCNPEYYDEMPDYIASLFNSKWLPTNMGNQGWLAWRDFVCTGNGYRVFYGDHLDPSASPSDPSFWSIHPMQERLLHIKYMTGGFSDDTWPSDSKHDYVCTLAQCYEASDDTYAYHEDCCYGHYETDQLMDWTTGNTNKGFGPTNKQTLKDTDPSSKNYAVEYIYDNFDFSHCLSDTSGSDDGDDDADDDGVDSRTTDDGYDFDTLVDTLFHDNKGRMRQRQLEEEKTEARQGRRGSSAWGSWLGLF